MDDDSTKLLAPLGRIPLFRGADLSQRVLTGSKTNRAIAVRKGNEEYVVRFTHANSLYLGLDRDAEYAILLAASEQGLAPRPIYRSRQGNVLVTSFVAGEHFTIGHRYLPDQLRMLAEHLRRVHQLPAPARGRNVFESISFMEDTIARNGLNNPVRDTRLQANVSSIINELRRSYKPCKLCHNEWSGNILWSDKVTLLDWEFAAVGDPRFDLASFIEIEKLTKAESLEFLSLYFTHPVTQNDIDAVLMNQVLVLYRAALYAVIQEKFSRLTFEFGKMVLTFAKRLMARVEGDEFARF
jgi:Phosphotransferase enzyme family.